MPINSFYLDQIVGRKEVKVRRAQIRIHRHARKRRRRCSTSAPTVRSRHLTDIIQAKEPPKCGSTGTASTGYLLAKIMDEAFKAKMATVTGYQGGSEIDIAVERGEIVCRGMDIPPHFGREPFDSWHKKGFDRHILQSGPKRDPRMGDAPTLFELMDQFKTPEVMRGVARGSSWPAAISAGRMLAGPGNPPERIKNRLREAPTPRRCAIPDSSTKPRKARWTWSTPPAKSCQALMKGADEPACASVVDRVKKISS